MSPLVIAPDWPCDKDFQPQDNLKMRPNTITVPMRRYVKPAQLVLPIRLRPVKLFLNWVKVLSDSKPMVGWGLAEIGA